MKYKNPISFLIFFLLLSIICFSQSVVNRANSSFTVQDSRFSAALNLFVPRYNDTTAANLQKGIDTCGAIIFTYSGNTFWGRSCADGKKWVAIGSGGGSGTVTSVSFTGGLISVANPTTTPAFTVAGTSGGIPYFSSSSAWATSAALAANSIVIGGGAGAAPSTTTTGTGVLTALGVNVGSAGAFVVNGGALGTPSGGTLTNATGLPITSGVSGLGTGVATALAVNVGSAGAFVTFNGALGTPSSGTLTNATGLPIIAGTTGTLTIARGGTNLTALGTALQQLRVNAGATALEYFTPSTPGIDDVLAVGQVLTTNRILDVGGQIFTIMDVATTGVQANFEGNAGIIELRTQNLSVTDNRGLISLESDNAGSHTTFDLYGFYDDGDKEVRITGVAQSSGGALSYEADTHEFTGNVGIGVSPSSLFQVIDGLNTFIEIDASFFTSSIAAADGTAESELELEGDLSGSDVRFNLYANDNTNIVRIEGDAVANLLTLVGPTRIESLAGSGVGLVATDNDGDISFKATTGSGSAVLAGAPSMSSITLAAGTATAGTAPLYMTAGTNLTVPVSGALEFDGTVHYSTAASGRGGVQSTMFARQTSDFTLQNSSADQNAFETAIDTWTLQGLTTYWVEGEYYITSGATSHSIAIGFTLGGGASVTSISYSASSWPVAVNTPTATQTATYITTVASTAVNLAGANATQYVTFKGYVSVNAGGTFVPIIKFSADPTGTCLMKAGSYIKFTAVGSNTVQSLGNVN